ncbi:MAG TPA: ATP-binding protein [Acidimicrobiales bacterium]
MSEESTLSAGDFGLAFKRFLEESLSQAAPAEPFFRARLTTHFGSPPTKAPILREQFPAHDHPNLQLAIDAHLRETGRAFDLLGVSMEHRDFAGLALGDLVAAGRGGLMGDGSPQEGPVDYLNLTAGQDETIACVQFGLYLIAGDAEAAPLAVLVRGPDPRGYGQTGVTVEVMALEGTDADAFLAAIRTRMRQHNVYRGRVVSLAKPQFGPLEVRFHHLPPIDRDGIVLAEGVLERIERQTIRVAQLSGRLQAAGRHLKRGLLLWGPPGTGKTLTAMYLAQQMPDRTVLVLTGGTLGLIDASCAMARLLQPATVIMEDVDLVAEERTNQSTGTNAVLFELLNQMDGLGDDADVLFLLTTNRPELLEPALASRPGRVDEAVEVPLPDAACRSKLLDLYGRGLVLDISDRARLIERTAGVSAAFIKELLRKAALVAADDSAEDPIRVDDEHLDRALFELVVEGGDLVTALLGGPSRENRRPDCD